MTRILIVAHAHPAVTLGGGEVAAYREFHELRRLGHEVAFVGMTGEPRALAALFRSGLRTVENGPSDFIVRCPPFDNFGYEFADVADEDFLVEFLAGFDADIVHFHHFWNIGTATIRRLRALKPDACFVITLHEYQVICAADGQMLKRGSLEPCTEGSPVACALCCGDHGPFSYVMRDRKMRRMLDQFDLVLAPSRFLRDRVVAADFDPGRITVLENGIGPVDAAEAVRPPAGVRASRFAFFGQATPTKGLDVLVDAAALLEDEDTAVAIDVYGVTAERFRALWPGRRVPDNVVFRGRYKPADAIALMRRFGWIVMPSVWWENSPVVIQEARAAGVPMIASRIGGVLEKTDGWSIHFNPGDAVDLARVMAEVAGDTERLETLGGAIPPPFTAADFVTALFTLVDAARGRRGNGMAASGDPAEDAPALAASA